MSELHIRNERPEDYYAAEAMARRAFWSIHGPGCSEHLLIRMLRKSEDYIPELTRVAELDGRIVGAVYYSRSKVVDGDTVHNVLTFGPLAVEPAMQNAGIGRKLLEATFPPARAMGYPGIVIFGEKDYYPRIGFRHCGGFGITDPQGNCLDSMMAYPLNEAEMSTVHGAFYESECFEQCENEALLAETEKEFPPYEKIKLVEGFLLLQDKRIGRAENGADGSLKVRFWEMLLPAYCAENVSPREGDIVLFRWHKNGLSEITQVCSNLY